MSGTTSYRTAGQTVALSVVATSHAAVPIVTTGFDSANFVGIINSGAVAVAINLSVVGTAATLPIDGTPGSFVIAPGSAQQVIPLPNAGNGAPCQITAIGAGAGPSIIYVTPLVIQT